MSEQRVEISGGTFALCFWLLVISLQIGDVADHLARIADALERAYPVEVAGER